MAKDIFISRIIKKYIDQLSTDIKTAGEISGKFPFVTMPDSPQNADKRIAFKGCPSQSEVFLNAGQTMFVDENGSDYVKLQKDNTEYRLLDFIPQFDGDFGVIVPCTSGNHKTGYDFNLNPCIWIEYSTDDGNSWIRISHFNIIPTTGGSFSRRYYCGPFPASHGNRIIIRLITGDITQAVQGSLFPSIRFTTNVNEAMMCIYYSDTNAKIAINKDLKLPAFAFGQSWDFLPTEKI